MPVIPALWENEASWFEPPVVPATQEAEAGELLGPGG